VGRGRSEKSVSATEGEALKLRIIDLISKDTASLLADVDGRKVKTSQGERTLTTRNTRIVRDEAGLRDRILNLISDPTVAYMLMLLGFYGLFFELTIGRRLPGVMGAISLILAFYAFQTLPVNYAGLLLILLGLILFLLEVKVASTGCSPWVALHRSSWIAYALRFSFPLLQTLPLHHHSTSLVTALFFAFTVRLGYRAHQRKPVTGSEGLLGLEGVTTSGRDSRRWDGPRPRRVLVRRLG